MLIDLHAKWLLYDKRATLAFWSNAGFAGSSHELWGVCTEGEAPSAALLDRSAASRPAGNASIPMYPSYPLYFFA